jgi:hypothetical protein
VLRVFWLKILSTFLVLVALWTADQVWWCWLVESYL